MPPRKSRPDLRIQKEAAILEAAAAVLVERGFRGTRIADVAERAGIGKGTVYEYFRSKEELFLRLFHWYTDQAFASMATTAEGTGGPALEVLQRSCDTLLVCCREIQDLYPLTMEFWSASTAPEFRERLTAEFRELYRRFRGTLADLIGAGIERGDIGSHVEPDALAAVLVGALDGIFLQAWFDPDFDPVAAGRHFLEVLVQGMRPVPPNPEERT
jgi:AcrR family transcriptional regulator